MEEKTEEAGTAGLGEEGGRRLQQEIPIGQLLQAIQSIQLKKGETRCFLDTACSDMYPAASLDSVSESGVEFQTLTSTNRVSGYIRNLPLPSNQASESVVIDIPPSGSPGSIGNGALKFFVAAGPSNEAQVSNAS
jgi:hypothetical protein